MFRIVSTMALMCVALLLLSGCEHKCPSSKSKDATSQAGDAKCKDHAGHDHGEAGHDGHAGHDHGEAGDDDHDGHDHGKADHDDHGEHDHGEAGHDDHDGHDHGEAGDDDHDDHDNGHGHSSQGHELGSHEIAGFTFEVVQFGAATDNVAEFAFEIDVQGKSEPTAIRLLVRAPDGAESLKVKADRVGDHEYHAHVGELPTELGEGSVLVVEVETPSGTEELMLPLKI